MPYSSQSMGEDSQREAPVSPATNVIDILRRLNDQNQKLTDIVKTLAVELDKTQRDVEQLKLLVLVTSVARPQHNAPRDST